MFKIWDLLVINLGKQSRTLYNISFSVFMMSILKNGGFKTNYCIAMIILSYEFKGKQM